jgi:UDP-N-acetylenolpyruvoylglucosamine reductase
MSLSDCIHCWSTPCECGWDYRKWPIKKLKERMNMLALIIAFKQQNPDAVFSTLSENQTQDDKLFMEFIGAWKER